MTLLDLGCFSSQPLASGAQGNSAGQPAGLGALRLSSEVLGRVEIMPAACTSGAREHFLGADFSDENNGFVIRLVVDPLDGPAVRVFSIAAPFDKSLVFRRSECRVFHFSLDSTAWRINDVQDYQVSLDLDCVSETGETLEGKVSANHCH
jgi:hypothetical protein